MFVLGIDPGLSRCGYGLVGQHPERAGGLIGRAAGVIETDPAAPLEERLLILHRELGALFSDLGPDEVAVERVFFQTNARTAMSVGQASGLALLASANAGIPVYEYTSNEVKQAVVGYGSATKAQVQRMVAHLLGLDEPPSPPDVADALALAICHLSGRSLRAALVQAGEGM
jgi:crossover junction endodeoxyribonuclease RuvC